MTTSDFDLAIIGAGPGGFDAALRARELGFKVALVEKDEPGGTCLNTGCIPTKTLLASTKLLTKIKAAANDGLSVSGASWDGKVLADRTRRIVETLRKGMLEILRRSGVEWITGEARLAGRNRLQIDGRGAAREIESRSILIATGTEPVPFPGLPFDGDAVLSSSQILELKKIPKELLILGGGIVGVEFASIFQPLGVKVTIVEMLERLIAAEDEEVSRRLESLFRRKGIESYTGERVKGLAVRQNRVEAALDSGKKVEAEQCLVAIGRKPHLDRLGLEEAGVKVKRGAIEVNEYLETSAPGIFAIGDVTTRSTGLAHGASAEGIRVIENLKGPKRGMNYEAVPSCIYTDPEVASVGKNVRTDDVVETKILFASLGRAQIEGETEGFVKMFASKKDGRILGVTGIGARMSELIHEATLAVAAQITVGTLAETIHAHPTEGEIFQKAAQKLKQLLDRG
jgi:dihydrolipoamide dehydrogenase